MTEEEQKLREFEKLCKPVADYLRKNCSPHEMILITSQSAKLVSDELGINLTD